MIHIQNMCLRSQTDSLRDGSCWKVVAPAARGDAAMGQKPQWINGKRGDPLSTQPSPDCLSLHATFETNFASRI